VRRHSVDRIPFARLAHKVPHALDRRLPSGSQTTRENQGIGCTPVTLCSQDSTLSYYAAWMRNLSTTERPGSRSSALPRVLHVAARMPYGGTERQLAGIISAARGVHWNPTLCVLYAGYPLTAELAAAGVHVIELPADVTHFDRASAVSTLLQDGVFDLIHTSQWGVSAFTRLLARTGCTPPLVMSERRVEEPRRAWRRRLDQWLEPSTAAFIAGSPDVAAFITQAHGAASEKIAVVPNGADPVRCRPRSAAVGVPTTPWRIGGAGRLVHQEGFDVLIDAAAHLSGRHDVELVIAGEGEMRRDLERRATGLPVRFVGSLNTPGAVTGFLRSLDVFVCPSRRDGQPRALVDALVCRLPVVATNVPSIRSVVGPDLDLVPIDDSQALAAALEAHKDACSERPPSVVSFDDAARAHLEVFRTVLSRQPSRVAATRSHTAIDSAGP